MSLFHKWIFIIRVDKFATLKLLVGNTATADEYGTDIEAAIMYHIRAHL